MREGGGGEEGEETLADKPQDFENSCPLSHFLLSPLKTYALGMDHNILKAWYEFCFTSLQFALAPFFARLKLGKFRSSDFFCSETPRKRLLRRLPLQKRTVRSQFRSPDRNPIVIRPRSLHLLSLEFKSYVCENKSFTAYLGFFLNIIGKLKKLRVKIFHGVESCPKTLQHTLEE